MYSGKALYNNGSASKMSGFQGSMFSATTFTIVLISNYNPWYTLSLKQKIRCIHEVLNLMKTPINTILHMH